MSRSLAIHQISSTSSKRANKSAQPDQNNKMKPTIATVMLVAGLLALALLVLRPAHTAVSAQTFERTNSLQLKAADTWCV